MRQWIKRMLTFARRLYRQRKSILWHGIPYAVLYGRMSSPFGSGAISPLSALGLWLGREWHLVCDIHLHLSLLLLSYCFRYIVLIRCLELGFLSHANSFALSEDFSSTDIQTKIELMCTSEALSYCFCGFCACLVYFLCFNAYFEYDFIINICFI